LNPIDSDRGRQFSRPHQPDPPRQSDDARARQHDRNRLNKALTGSCWSSSSGSPRGPRRCPCGISRRTLRAWAMMALEEADWVRFAERLLRGDDGS
jgi:hypothetical protein